MKKLCIFLMMAALTTALSAQSDEYILSNVWVYVSPATGGTAEEREYFDFNLQEEVIGGGYALADSEENSDFIIDVELSYDQEYNEHIITLFLYRTETGELLVTSGMVYETLDEMYDWNLTLIYRVMANAPISKSLGNELIVTRSGSGWNTDPDYWLKVGLRGGPSLRLYNPMTSTYTNSVSFDAGLQVTGQILPFLGIQAEMLFTTDSAPFLGIKDEQLTALEYATSANSLLIPLVVKGTFRYKRFLLAPFAGLYFTIPLNKMIETEKNAVSLDAEGNSTTKPVEAEREWKYTVPLGFTGGIAFGVRLGPGTLFLDTRYMIDFGDTQINRPGQVKNADGTDAVNTDGTPKLESGFAVYRRSGVSFTLGYEFNIFPKKPKQ
jgi:hypothetical protein